MFFVSTPHFTMNTNNQKKALITGISGQDGSYLAEFLIGKGYEVHGVVRNKSQSLWRHEYLGISSRVRLHACDLKKMTAVTELLEALKPSEIYHLAAESSVVASLEDPLTTLSFAIESTLIILESLTVTVPMCKFFHASSCEIFGTSTPSPLTVTSPIGTRAW